MDLDSVLKGQALCLVWIDKPSLSGKALSILCQVVGLGECCLLFRCYLHPIDKYFVELL